MSQFDNLRDKAQGLADDHPDKVEEYSDQAGEKGGDMADKATGGKYGDQIDTGQDKLDDMVGSDGDEASKADREQGGL